jgi:hypothetical protein
MREKRSSYQLGFCFQQELRGFRLRHQDTEMWDPRLGFNPGDSLAISLRGEE